MLKVRIACNEQKLQVYSDLRSGEIMTMTLKLDSKKKIVWRRKKPLPIELKLSIKYNIIKYKDYMCFSVFLRISISILYVCVK